MDILVKPVPILQLINILFGLFILSWAWPLPITQLVKLFEKVLYRVFTVSFAIILCFSLYGNGDAVLYYIISIILYLWAYVQRERIC